MSSATAEISTRVLSGFEDPQFGPAEWDRLLRTGESDTVFLSWQWQFAWWKAFQRGELLLIAAQRLGEVVALAPLFSQAGMVYFVGSGGSDYLDFIGDIGDAEVLDALLTEARQWTTGFIGLVFYHVPDHPQTGARLERSSARLGLRLFDQGAQSAPALEIAANIEVARAATQKQSLVRHERFFSRDNSFKVEHIQDGEAILPHLDAFFAQHRERWSAAPSPSLFNEPAQQEFYRLLATVASTSGWLRFTVIQWQGRAIAYHFGFNYRGTFLWYKPTFAIALARHSPGEVLLRQLLLLSLAEGCHTFDFGLGDEAFKARFATRVGRVQDWGVYDPRALTHSDT